MPTKDPEKIRVDRDKRLTRYRRRMRWVNRVKTEYGCDECGFNSHPAALDFDHIDPSTKSFLIPRKVGNGNLKALIAEIRKCRILCANCHRVHSRTQWDNGVTNKKRG